jgi:hypothetical protein
MEHAPYKSPSPSSSSSDAGAVKMLLIKCHLFIRSVLPEPVAQSVGGSDCGSEAIFSVHLNRQDCSGGSEL